MSWTLKQPRTRSLRQGEKQTHKAALRASRYVRRHAWQFHGAGVEAAVRDLQRICDWSPDCEVHGMVGGSVVMEKFEPYAWQFIVTGERMPEGSPFFQQVTGVDAYEFSEIRAAMEDMTRKAFTHEYPGVNIIGERWYPLYDFGGDDE